MPVHATLYVDPIVLLKAAATKEPNGVLSRITPQCQDPIMWNSSAAHPVPDYLQNDTEENETSKLG